MWLNHGRSSGQAQTDPRLRGFLPRFRPRRSRPFCPGVTPGCSCAPVRTESGVLAGAGTHSGLPLNKKLTWPLFPPGGRIVPVCGWGGFGCGLTGASPAAALLTNTLSSAPVPRASLEPLPECPLHLCPLPPQAGPGLRGACVPAFPSGGSPHRPEASAHPPARRGLLSWVVIIQLIITGCISPPGAPFPVARSCRCSSSRSHGQPEGLGVTNSFSWFQQPESCLSRTPFVLENRTVASWLVAGPPTSPELCRLRPLTGVFHPTRGR